MTICVVFCCVVCACVQMYIIRVREYFDVTSYIEWRVTRRYKQFETMHANVCIISVPCVDFPQLPPKQFFVVGFSNHSSSTACVYCHHHLSSSSCDIFVVVFEFLWFVICYICVVVHRVLLQRGFWISD